jgi:hypothetical protein
MPKFVAEAGNSPLVSLVMTLFEIVAAVAL